MVVGSGCQTAWKMPDIRGDGPDPRQAIFDGEPRPAYNPRVRHVFILLAALAGAALGGCEHGSKPAHERTNVLLVVLDTTRADRLSCYGYPRATTPALDRLAESGVRFERAYANSSWTLDSHASMFTGLYPVGHRATQETLRLSEGPATLAEILTDAGYRTFATSANPVVCAATGLARGFERFSEAFREKAPADAEHPNNAAFRAFLAGAGRDRPFFAFVNFIEPHLPYSPPEPHRSRFVGDTYPADEVESAGMLGMADHYMKGPLTPRQLAVLSDLYNGEVATVDEHVGALLGILDRDGRATSTLVIVTSDHGENLGEHGHFAHVFDIHDTLVRVPLIVRFPGGGQARAGTVRRDIVTLVDLFPTILDSCAVNHESRGPGRGLFAGPARSSDDVVMAEYYYPRQVFSVLDPEALELNWEKFVPFMRRLRAVRDGSFKLIWGSSGPSELYDMTRDPEERENLLAGDHDHPARLRLEAAMQRLVALHQGEVPLEPPPPIGWMMPGFEERADDPERIERLRSLGYVR